MAPGKVTQFSKPNKDDQRESVPEDKKLSLPATKKVMMDKIEPPHSSGVLTHFSIYDRMLFELQRNMELRNQFEIIETVDKERINLTPKPISASYETEGYAKLIKKYNNLHVDADDGAIGSFRSFYSSLMKVRSSRGVGLRVSLDDIINGITCERVLSNLSAKHSWKIDDLDSSSNSSSSNIVEAIKDAKSQLPFIRIVLRKTELLLLYEQQSKTAIKSTEDGNFTELDNKQYEYLTIGRGKIRQRSEAEAQTSATLFKTREINTKTVKTMDTGSYVSQFDMFQTFNKPDEEDKCDEKKLHIFQNNTPEEQAATIVQLPSFHSASVIMKRLLAGNTFEQGQRRFRNINQASRMVDKIQYKYSINKLFAFNPDFKDNIRKAVSDMSFCYGNSDILAVAYGIYSYQAAKLPKTGEVCVWSIKNPHDPERFYYYNVPVVSLEFSPYTPTLLAIGLNDGMVEVQDIAQFNQPHLAISERTTSPGVSPVLAIKWFQQLCTENQCDIDPFLTLSQDGSVTQFRIINSPFLVGSKLITLERIEGMPEGLDVIYSSELTQHTNRCQQGLSLTKHPVQPDIYYILTDEGCIHKCSINYQDNYLEVLKTHDGAVNCMDFSPWSPKLFMTCGNDWCIRIWIEGIFKPLIVLKNLYGPYQWANWSRTHSTVLIAINRKQCEVWDLKRSILKPMSITALEQSYNTMGIFSLDGYSLAVGNERGKVIVNALDDMPFPPYYQYDALEKTIYKATSNYPDLMIELKSLGSFGYPNKDRIVPP